MFIQIAVEDLLIWEKNRRRKGVSKRKLSQKKGKQSFGDNASGGVSSVGGQQEAGQSSHLNRIRLLFLSAEIA